jgi:hypothetical protein
VPALLGWLALGPAHFADILTITAALMVPAALLPAFVLGDSTSRGSTVGQKERSVWHEIREDFADPRIPVLLGTNFLAFLAYIPVFFFLKEYAEGRGIENPGTFFSVGTGAMIAIRLLEGTLFDHLNKAKMLIFANSQPVVGGPVCPLFLCVPNERRCDEGYSRHYYCRESEHGSEAVPLDEASHEGGKDRPRVLHGEVV